MLVSNGGSGFNTDDLMRRDLSKTEWTGWNLTSYATVMYFRRQVKCWEYDTVLVGFCNFQLPIWFAFVVIIVRHIFLDDFLKFNDVFVGKINIHEC